MAAMWHLGQFLVHVNSCEQQVLAVLISTQFNHFFVKLFTNPSAVPHYSEFFEDEGQ